IARAVTGGRVMRLRMDIPTVALLVLFAASLFSIVPPLLSGSPAYLQQYLKSTAHFSYMWLFAVCCASTVVQPELVVRLFRVLVVCAIPINIFGIYQVPARAFDWPLAWIEYTGSAVTQTNQLSLEFEGFFRATSIFSEPSAYALFTMTTLIILLVPYLFFDLRIVRSRTVFLASVYTCFIGMFLTFSLTIILLFGAFVIAVFLLSRRSTVRKLAAMFSVMTAVFIITNTAIASYADADLFDLYFRRVASNIVGEDKVEAVSGDSFGDRAAAQRAALSIWQRHPLLGSGFGCLGFVKGTDGLYGVSALQMYVYTMATTGTIGGAAIVVYSFGMGIAVMRMLIRRQRERGASAEVGAEDIALSVAAFLCCNEAVHGLSSDDLILQYHWVVMGVASLVYYHPRLRAAQGVPVMTLGFTPYSTVSLAGTGTPINGKD
ncbi:MAG: O-antigen ligase family protein, partial [Candidatus Kapaibacterium sp.]